MLHELTPSSEKPRIRTPQVLRRVGEATLDTLARFRMLPDDKKSGRPLAERHIPQISPTELGANIQNPLIRLRPSRHSRARHPALTPVSDIIDKTIPELNPKHLFTHTHETGVNSAYKHLSKQHRD
jgi:hypothetical protein